MRKRGRALKKSSKREQQKRLIFGTVTLFIVLAAIIVIFIGRVGIGTAILPWKNKEAAGADDPVEATDLVNEVKEDEYVDNGPPEGWFDAVDEPEEPKPQDTTILFAGDVLFDYGMPQHYDESGITGVVSPEVLELMRGADITMVNQEFAFGTTGTAQAKEFTFRCNPSYVTAFGDMGVDVVSLANNHALDYGTDALTETFSVLDGAGVKFAGAGPSLERAQEAQIFEVNDKKIGFLAASRVIPFWNWNITDAQPGMLCTYDPKLLCEAISRAKEKCDYVFVYVHWGVEREEFPQDYQFTLAKQYAKAGADAVIGSHPHVLQGAEMVEGIPVFYSLGNFIFNVNINRTMMVTLTISPEGLMTWRILPCYVTGGVTCLADGDKAEDIRSYIQSISFDMVINDMGEISWIQNEAEPAQDENESENGNESGN